MAASTTLMTFLVRTPPTTRSVTLYGSWDNFTKSYDMKRDVRLGTEHWSGCHSFSNIICDGNTDGLPTSRDGGLKMGGTYWYYYKLDDEIEFHNSAEPSTTYCPLLPGQLVNVLQVPFALSGARGRNLSVSSSSSDLRTLNPDDKFMNPRPVPMPSKLLRLTTSPSVAQAASSRDSSPCEDDLRPGLMRSRSRENLLLPNPFRINRKASFDTLGRAGHGNSKSTGLRQAFRALRSGRSQSPDSRYKHIVDWTPCDEIRTSVSAPQTPEAQGTAASYFDSVAESTSTLPSRGLLFRSTSDLSLPTTSFLEHRRERSRSREPSSLRQSRVVDNNVPLDLDPAFGQNGPLSALLEVASPQNTPGQPRTAVRDGVSDGNMSTPTRDKGELQLEKRLPTLPNTPSSAYPPSLLNISPPRNFSQDVENWRSRFSATTIDTTCHLNSMIKEDTSRFSEWSNAEMISPMSDSTMDDSINSPVTSDEPGLDPIIRHTSTEHADQKGVVSGGEHATSLLSSTFSTMTVSSAVSTASSVSYDDQATFGVPRAMVKQDGQASAFMVDDFQHYSLPETKHSSEVTLKRFDSHTYHVTDVPGQLHVRNQTQALHDRRQGLPHSESMQQLLDELSYLSGVIVHS